MSDPLESLPKWSVQFLSDRRYRKTTKQYEYRVKWLGFPDEESTWEPKSNLINDVPLLVEGYDLYL